MALRGIIPAPSWGYRQCTFTFSLVTIPPAARPRFRPTCFISHSVTAVRSLHQGPGQQPSPSLQQKQQPPKQQQRQEGAVESSSPPSSSTASLPSSNIPNAGSLAFTVPPPPPPPREPSYEITFTCRPCSTRSTHRMSKQGYHHGSVLITCPQCKSRHVMSDHLNIFGDRKMTIEDIVREKGNLMKRGTLDSDGDLEFWDDGSVTRRQERNELPPERRPAAPNEEELPPGSTFRSLPRGDGSAGGKYAE